MCLYTTQEIPTIAEKDIICYKIIRKDMSSLYHDDFKWEFRKIYTSWIEAFERRTNNDYTIHQAFHSYKTLKDLKRAYETVTVPCLAVKCTIPKGSRVYKGKHGSIEGYASNQLIINKAMDVKELYPNFDWDNYPYKEGQVIQIKISDDGIWEDYQIMNISLFNKSRVYLLVDNCRNSGFGFINTTFDKGTWVANKDIRLKESKGE